MTAQEGQENQINIINFQPFEVGILLRHIYYPSTSLIHPDNSLHHTNHSPTETDVDVARLGTPSGSFLETCVRMWHLGDFYEIRTLTETAEDQMRWRIQRYVNESGHTAIMANRMPFLPDLEDGIRAAWEPKRAAGRPRLYLLILALSVSCYLKSSPSFISLLEEEPGFTSEFTKLLIGNGEATTLITTRRSPRTCMTCRQTIFLTGSRSGVCQLVHYMSGAIMIMIGDTEIWFCSKGCFEKTKFYSGHISCGICEKERLEGLEKVTDRRV